MRDRELYARILGIEAPCRPEVVVRVEHERVELSRVWAWWASVLPAAAGVTGMMGLSWDEVDGVMRQGVERGLARWQVKVPERLGVDESSF